MSTATSQVRLNAPFVELTPSDEAQPGTMGSAIPVPLLPTEKNYASNPDVCEYISSEIYPVIQWTRINRTNLEEEWREILRMEHMLHDGGRRYLGRSDPYLPIYARSLDTRVSALSRGLFPSDEYFDVSDANPDPQDPDAARKVKAYIQWELDTVAKLRAHVKDFLRQLENFGNSVMKFWYHKDLVKKGRGSLERTASGLTPSFRPTASLEGFRVSTRSMLYWYIYPLSAESLDDATLVFEDIDVPRGFIKEQIRRGMWLNGEEALSAPIPSNHLTSQSDLITNTWGAAPPSLDVVGRTDIGGIKTITEAYTFMRLPKDAYMDFEDPQEPIPVKLTMAGRTCLEVRRNPFFHQKPPYLAVFLNRTPGFIYGNGTGRRVKPMQYLANDFAGQTNDCGIYSLNPISKVNPGMVVGPLPKIAPGKTWYFTDIEQGHKFDRPPVELIQAGLQMLQLYTGMAQDYGGAPPSIQGSSASKGAKTATGAQILQRNALAPLQDIVEDLELGLLMPLLTGAWLNAQQYRDKEVMAVVAGQPILVRPEDLAIDARFKLLASSQAANQQQRAQQATQFLSVLGPLVPVLQQQGVMVNFVPILRRIWSDGLGFRNFDEVVKSVAPTPLQIPGASLDGGGMPTPPPPTAPGGETEDSRSALENIPGAGPQDMAPGEGNEMQEVRQMAAALAAQAGRQGGA